MRIASLISAGTEMLYAIGLGERVVAVSHECDWPVACQMLPRVTRSNIEATASSEAIDNQVRGLLREGKALYEVDIARLAALAPDLIVTQSQCDVCAVQLADVQKAVRSEPRLNGTDIFSLNPQSLADVFDDMERLAQVAGIESQGKMIVERLQQRVENVRRQTAKIAWAKRPRVAVIEWVEPLMLAGNWVPEMVELAGGTTIFANVDSAAKEAGMCSPPQRSRVHTWEELLRFDPQVIVVCPCGFDHVRSIRETEQLSRKPRWNRISAVQTKRVYPIDGNAYFNRPGPRLVESLELLARLVDGALHSTGG
jgi:iron complex transport system substrate-binding protein